MEANIGANAPIGTTTAVYTETSKGISTPHPLSMDGNHSNHEYAKVSKKKTQGFLSVLFSIISTLLGRWISIIGQPII
jgi:hypothetical protein